MDVKELITYLLSPIAQVALIVGIAQLLKQTGLKKKWIPLCDLAFGLFSGLIVYGYALGYGVIDGAVLGIAIGLSACGLFSGIKNVTKK